MGTRKEKILKLNKGGVDDMVKQSVIFKPSNTNLKKAIEKRKSVVNKGSSKDYAKTLYHEFKSK